MVDSCLHCKFRNGAWRPRAAFQDRVLSFEDRIIYIDYKTGVNDVKCIQINYSMCVVFNCKNEELCKIE